MAKSQITPLTIRKLAQPGAPADPITGAKPLAGLQFVEQGGEGVADPPKRTMVPTSTVERGEAEGWISVEGVKIVHAAGGSEQAPWSATHTFRQLDAIVFHTPSGEADARYRVVAQPGKFDKRGEFAADAAGDPETEVRWTYELELEG